MSEPVAPPPSSPPPPGTGEPAEPTPGALPRVGWGPASVLTGLVALLLVMLVQVGVISALDPGLESLGARFAVQVGLAVSLVAVAFLIPRSGALTAPGELGLRRSLIPPLRPAALAYLAYIGCALLIAIAIQPEQEDVTEQLGYGESALANVLVGLLVVGAAPITEELFFRGFMFAGLRRRLPFAAAAAASAGLWGLFHYTGPGTLGVVLQLAAFGIILSWLYERTGSIWPPIAVHALNNALAFAILTS